MDNMKPGDSDGRNLEEEFKKAVTEYRERIYF
jgi:hypothetical protein